VTGEWDDEVGSSGSSSPRFSRQTRRRAGSSSPMMMRASEPPIKDRRFDLLTGASNRPSDMTTSQSR